MKAKRDRQPIEIRMAAPPDGRRVRTPGGSVPLKLLLELLVVFVGVYAAFALSQYQDQRSADARRIQLQAALVREIVWITGNTRPVASEAPLVLANLQTQIVAGARPPLVPMMDAVRVDTHMWEATLQSGGLDLFDVETIYRLSSFYNSLNAGFEQLDQLRVLSESVLLPNLGRGPDEFYDTRTGQLLPKYEWYVQGLRRLGQLTTTITAQGDSLIADLSR